MRTLRKLSPLTKVGLASLALAAPLAIAGHLNVVLKADLDGREEVNTSGTTAIVGDPDGRGEVYVFGIDANADVLCYVLLAKKIGELDMAPGNGRAAHIHAGVRGSNGPVVAALAWPQGGQSGDCLDPATQPARFPMGGSVVADIKANPQNYYVNVHNAEYPGGALRGQLGYATTD
ncbi:MAG TPA: CHRD domain-containing protein [Burkholderiaceae bacterium]|nr:CHRD domain-containing protein [Burkholderiaceae bacterium]